jgi:hypothetical protein
MGCVSSYAMGQSPPLMNDAVGLVFIDTSVPCLSAPCDGSIFINRYLHPLARGNLHIPLAFLMAARAYVLRSNRPLNTYKQIGPGHNPNADDTGICPHTFTDDQPLRGVLRALLRMSYAWSPYGMWDIPCPKPKARWKTTIHHTAPLDLFFFHPQPVIWPCPLYPFVSRAHVKPSDYIHVWSANIHHYRCDALPSCFC